MAAAVTTKLLGVTDGTRNWSFRTTNQTETTSSVTSSPAIGPDGTIYVGVKVTTSVGNGRVIAVNPNGTLKWTFEGPTDWVESSPAIGADGTVYAGSWDGKLYAITPPTTGTIATQKWAFPTGAYIYSSPAIAPNGTIYVGSGDFTLHAISPAGVELWQRPAGDWIDSSPAVGGDGTVYFGSWDRNIYAVNSDGSEKWRVATAAAVISSPAVGPGGVIYCGSGDGRLYAIAPDGSTLWTYATGDAIQSSPVLGADGTVFFGSNDRYFYALNANGTLKWRVNIGQPVASTAAVRADGSVIFGADDNKIHALKADGTALWTFAFSTSNDSVDSSPVIATDGTIYVGSIDGPLYSLNGTVAPLSTGYWPMFHQGPRHTGLAIAPPAFTTQPQSQSVVVGASVTFTAVASGQPAPTYQWKKDGTNISGATSATLTLSNVQLTAAATYTVVATNSVASATSSGAVLTVNPAAVAPAITTQPQSQTVVVGASVTFTAAANGTPTPTFQWRKGAANIVGATGATLTLNNVQLADAASYTVVATNSVGSATSNAAVLTVNAPPVFTTQPQSVAVLVGTTATLTAAASGTPAPTYQWKKDATNISGATGATLVLNNAQLADAATYTVVATNVVSSVTSSAAVLSVGLLPVAPAITTQPQSQIALVGATVTLTAAASGIPTPTFQWKKAGADIAGATGATLTLASVQFADAGSYSVVATNLAGSATGGPAVLAVNAPPAFVTQPQSQTVAAGGSVTFTAAASGTPAPTYQWSKGGVEMAGQTGATLTLANVQPADAATYFVVATNSVASVTSNNAVLTVNFAPAITTPPQSQSAIVGTSVAFTVAASGTPAPAFQWKKGGADIAGATGATLIFANVQFADAGSYTVVATNSLGSAASGAAVLTVNPVPPTIVTQPAGHTIAVGATVVFAIEATGNGLTYQWRKGGAAIAGATSARLILTNAQSGAAANYTVTVGNSGGGSVASSAAALAVIATADPGRIVNLSIRGTSGTGNKVLIMGFVTGGDGTVGSTSLLIRGAGPSIIPAPYYVTDALADPAIQVIPAGSSTPFASNDNWGGTPALKAAALATGAFPFIGDDSKDAALVSDFPRNLYSVIVSGNGATGSVLAEIYDVNLAGTFDPAVPRLVNISARAFVGSTDALTAGFVVVGQTAKTVLIRAIGPDPTFAANVGNANLGDPSLAVYHAHDGISELILSNDNWGGDPQLTTVGNSVGAAALTNAASKDAVVLATLDPGVYSALDLPLNGTSGITLVEVYEVP